jgi:hypothetical protein
LNDETFHAVLGARFLEMILWVWGSQMRAKSPDEPLKIDCQDAFQILSAPSSSGSSQLWIEQVDRYGPTDLSEIKSLPRMVAAITTQQTWPVVERLLLEMHLHTILKRLDLAVRNSRSVAESPYLWVGNYEGLPDPPLEPWGPEYFFGPPEALNYFGL